jgi:hypothetical protein
MYIKQEDSHVFECTGPFNPVEVEVNNTETSHSRSASLLLLYSFYKGVVPLWMRQIPYTMMKFACFERTVELLYKHVVPKPRAECSKGEQLVVTFVAGYIGESTVLKRSVLKLVDVLFWLGFQPQVGILGIKSF